jgi:hypothetical protein
MKAKLTIEIDFESWFDNEPKNNQEWIEYFLTYFITESGVIGVDSGDGNCNLISIISTEITNFKITNNQ